MNTQTRSLLWTPCSQSVFAFDSDIHVPWGNKYTDPFTPVNTLFTKCIHIVLTVACQDDLLALKVTNELHHISIKRGIQILRLNGFNPGCLRRRPFPEEVSQQFIFSCLHCDPLPHPFYTPAPTPAPHLTHLLCLFSCYSSDTCSMHILLWLWATPSFQRHSLGKSEVLRSSRQYLQAHS